MKNRFIYTLISFALILSFVVVVLGAYTRLTDSGLGCPDWPGCYGKLVLPHSKSGLVDAQKVFPEQPVEEGKAWKEMIHRYAAGTLGLLIAVLWVISLIKRSPHLPRGLCTRLLILIGFQAALGMWTVTWKLLPMVVMGHLLGGLAIFSLLRYLQLKVYYPIYPTHSPRHIQRPWIIIALLLIVLQIALGGWVSANYASLACIGFPQCNGIYFPPFNFHDAFHLSSIGANYQGGNLDSTARITIQMVHRFNAFLTAGYITILSVITLRKENKALTHIHRFAKIALFLVLLQFIFGVILVTHLLPLSIAVLHNATAALLLFSAVSWLFYYNNDAS